MRIEFSRILVGMLVCLPLVAAPSTSQAEVSARIKDIARIRDVRPNQLVGLGIVTGLNGSGDDEKLASSMIRNVLEKLHVTIPAGDISSKNVAAVMVMAEVPPFLAEGSRLDIQVSCIGSAKSLEGGTLLQTPLQGANGIVYAVAQGAVSTGSFAVSGEAAKLTKNHPTVGRIPAGAILERCIPTLLRPNDDIFLVLNSPDFVTAVRTADAINTVYDGAAKPMDAGTIQIHLPPQYRTVEGVPTFVAHLDSIRVTPDVQAKVIVNERTGTIVFGDNVRLSTVAISHGNLTISVKETTRTSQPNAFSSSGETRTEKTTDISAVEQKPGIYVMEEAATIADVARALNVLGVSPRDMVAIFQALKQAGALQCELIII